MQKFIFRKMKLFRLSAFSSPHSTANKIRPSNQIIYTAKTITQKSSLSRRNANNQCNAKRFTCLSPLVSVCSLYRKCVMERHSQN